MHEEGIRESEEAVRLSGATPFSKVILGLGPAKAGQLDKARKILEELKREPKLDNLSEYYLAGLHGILGEKEEAFKLLEKAYEQRNIWLVLLSAPPFDSLRDDPRFADVFRRIGLPESVSTQTRDQGLLEA